MSRVRAGEAPIAQIHQHAFEPEDTLNNTLHITTGEKRMLNKIVLRKAATQTRIDGFKSNIEDRITDNRAKQGVRR